MVLAVGTFAISESIFYIANSHKLGYNIWHKWNIDILLSDSDSKWKFEPRDISYTICWCGFTHSNNDISHNDKIG